MTSNTKEVSETETFIHELRRQNMNNEYKPVLIYNGNEHDLKNHGELICGGCGYVFSSNEAEELFKNVEFKPGCRGFGGDLYSSAPLCCIQCFQEFEKYTSANAMRHFIFIHRLYLKNATLLNMVNLFCQEKATMLSLSRLGIRVKEERWRI